MNRTSIINYLLKYNKGKKYLEIGVYDGINLNNINCEYKVGVDPDPNSKATLFITSDHFFRNNQEKFDLIFIDGLHHSDQVLKDINNSLNILNDNGFIVCHDMNPEKEEHQVLPYNGGIWNGDCWKAFVQLKRIRPDLEMFVVDTDYGCGIITKGKQEVLQINEDINWKNFKENKKKWLNLISINEFLKKYFIEIDNNDGLLKLLYEYINDSSNSENNYKLGLYYESIGQTASALSYYLRTAERTKDELLQYECLIRSAMCFDKQGARNFTVKGLLQHALSIQPKRPEGYYLLSRFYEKENKDGSWNDCYTISSIGCRVVDKNIKPLRTSVDYPGYYALLFQKALSAWWCGLCEESRDLYKNLYYYYNLNDFFKQSVVNNLNFLKVEIKEFDWGLFKNKPILLECLKKEFEESNYEKEFEVKENDIVVDIGASVGPFINNIIKKRPSKIICLEPHKKLFETLKNNFNFCPNMFLLNKAIFSVNGRFQVNKLFNEDEDENNLWNGKDYVDCITFTKLIEDFNLDKIDFLKVDCEGGEYDIFTDQNFKWIKENIKKIAGEWHLHNQELKQKFKIFRDLYLKNFNFKAYFVDKNSNFTNISVNIWDNNFINKIEWINIYIDNNFDWGNIKDNCDFLKIVNQEIFIDNVYEKFFCVEKNDTVVDIGASVGPFSYSILNKNPKHIYCLEPHKKLFETLKNNLNQESVTCINAGISNSDGSVSLPGLYNPNSMDMWSISGFANGITFETFIKRYKIEKIDFLKIDCEGGEYDVFNKQNLGWLLCNTNKIAGEWHLHNQELKQKFKIFRDEFLSKIPDSKLEVYSMDEINIKHDLWTDWFIDYYACIMIYINLKKENK